MQLKTLNMFKWTQLLIFVLTFLWFLNSVIYMAPGKEGPMLLAVIILLLELGLLELTGRALQSRVQKIRNFEVED